MIDLTSIAAALKANDHYVICPHRSPDPDGLGSALGLARILRQLGKRAEVYVPEPIGTHVGFLLRYGEVRQEPPEPGARFILVDCAEVSRVSPGVEVTHPWLAIDHHVNLAPSTELALIDPAAGATAQLVAQLAEALGVAIDEPIATCLYAGLSEDTGQFVYSYTSPETHRVAGLLLAAGARPDRIYHELNNRRSVAATRLAGMMLSVLQEDLGGQLVWTMGTRKMLEATGATADDYNIAVEEMRAVGSAEAYVLFKEMGDRDIKVSLRAREHLDVNAVARRFGGGGHVLASGCSLQLPLNEAILQVINAVREDLIRLLALGPATRG